MQPSAWPPAPLRSDRWAVRRALVLLGAVGVAVSSLVLLGGVAIRRGLDSIRIAAPDLENLRPELFGPQWSRLRAVDLTTGATRWDRPIGSDVAETLAPFRVARGIDASTRVVRDGQQVVAEVVATGEIRWASHLGRPVLGFGPVAGDAVGVVVFGNEAGALTETVFLDTATGTERWRTPSGLLSSFAYDQTSGTLYEYGEDRALLARDPAVGTVLWRVDRAYGRLFANEGTVWVAGDGRVSAYDGATGAAVAEVAVADLGDALPVTIAESAAVLLEP